MRILVSACLLGCACRYDGGSSPSLEVLKLSAQHVLIPVCPEQLGGLPTPRPPCEIRGDRVLTRAGEDCTAAFRHGASEAMRLYRLLGCERAILKRRSPSCSPDLIYDGSFSGRLTNGSGLFARLLLAEGQPVCSEENLFADL